MSNYVLNVIEPVMEPGQMPPPEMLEPIMRSVNAVSEEIQAAGEWVFAGALFEPEATTVVRHQDGETLMTDGPYVEGKEHIGGFTVVDSPDLDAAGSYQLQTAVAAVHSAAATVADTDWRQVVQLYDQLMQVAPSPVVALNRAVAVAELEGPAAGLDLVDDLELDQMGLFHAIRADLLRRVGRRDAAREAYGLALERTDNVAERSFLERQTAEL